VTVTYHLSNTQRKELLDRGSPLLLALPVPLDRPADLVAWARSVLEPDIAPLVAEAQRRSIWVAIFSGRDRETLTGNGSGLTGLTQSQISGLVDALAAKLASNGNGSGLTGLTVSQLSDASANGKSLISAVDYAAMKVLLGLVIGTDVLAPTGNGSGLTSLNASSIASGTIPSAARLGSGSASSSTYLRGDLSWATVSADPPPILPFARISTLMGSSLNPGTAQPSVLLTANRWQAWLSQPMPLFTSLKLQITVTTATAGGKARFAVYNRASDCGPGTLIGESGEVDCSTTGNKSVTVTCTNSVTGLKWLAILANSSSIAIRGHAKQSSLGRLDGGYAWYDTIYRAVTYGAVPTDETSQPSYTPLEADFPEIMWRGT